MSVVVRIENLSKVYQRGELNRKAWLEGIKRKLTRTPIAANDAQMFWALRDVNFEVKQGDVLGLLGNNGAGKSTLLKILSQITSPSSGRLMTRGRIASLLEVGTGFHPDLNGRDNIFLNGTILGMARREISAKFDEIVAFSGVEEFIDTPVKRYSMGMRVRLAFAVAAHLEPEILVIDEVLAVGDAVFQQKCLGKIGEVAHAGRTVLFVSHDAAAVEALCTRGLVLHQGRVVFEGTQTEAIEFYSDHRTAAMTDLAHRTDRQGTGQLRIEQIEIRNSRGENVAIARSGQQLDVVLRFRRKEPGAFPRLAAQIHVTTHLGAPVFTQANWLGGEFFGELGQTGKFICRLPRLPLPSGHFQLGFRLLADARSPEPIDAIENAFDLQVEGGNFFGSGKLPPLKAGVALVDGNWRLEPC